MKDVRQDGAAQEAERRKTSERTGRDKRPNEERGTRGRSKTKDRTKKDGREDGAD